MTYLSHLYLPGALALWSALFFALAAVWGYSLVLRGDGNSLVFARRAYNFFALSMVLTAGVLVLLLRLRDFRIEYVYQYSGLDLPGHFQIAAFWAGQKGSFLIWLLWGTLLGLGVKRTAGKAEPAVMIVYLLTVLGILLILVRENPFVMLGQTPVDGQGLNPLLQNNWMVIHPPIMFVGYAASAIPFAFAMASLWRRDYDNWAARAFPWALGGFLVLGTAILMGGYWAYITLGWGGYWGWDPVENASLIPWLFGTVMIHGLHMERTKKRYRRANYVFATLTYIAVLYGTFLTRSGVLADFSVHSFVDLGISGLLLFGMGTFILLSIYLIVTRWKDVPTEKNEDPLLSRGTFMVLATITIFAAALVITVGTSAPLITTWLMRLHLANSPGQVGPSFYNTVNLPIAFLVAFLLSLVPYLTWRGEGTDRLLRKIAVPAVAALVVAAGAAVWRIHNPFHVAFVFLAALALGSNLQKVGQKFKVSGLRGAGGYLAHVGVGIILLGILSSSGYDESTKVTLEQGKPTPVGDLTLTFERYVPRTAGQRERMEIKVARADGKSYLAYPKLFMNDRTRQLMANPDVHTTFMKDFYISPIDYDPGRPSLELAKGKVGKIGSMEVRFVNFDLQVEGNAMAQMAAGKPVTIGANLEVTRNGVTQPVKALYRMNPADGRVETPPAPLPGGGQLVLAGINASSGAVQVETEGVANPARLSVDVTKKPLIIFVWGGLYVVLIGGLLSILHRVKEIRVRTQVGEIQ
ncbi:MAG TPA: cytochrome c biogenesis protein CcsA [Thermoanaerobaculia bacterium]|nr:cytochrome c biogenesis protein CcsA [Thermoanaerobaculia bacterium]